MGWGLGAYCSCVEPGLSPCVHSKNTRAASIFFNDTATTEIYTLSLHDALPISAVALCSPCAYHVPHYTAQALRAETAAYATLARLSTLIT